MKDITKTNNNNHDLGHNYDYQVKTPIAFFIYNRPALTKKVFAEIAKARPSKLFIVADGPSTNSNSQLCEEARQITYEINWPCEVRRNFSDIKLGCRRRISSGINWVFSQVEEIILIEDDILPHPSFFRYCDEMLERYRNNQQVMMVAGTNLFQIPHPEHSYFFSRYPGIWGWALWRRAWEKYDVNIGDWPLRKKGHEISKYFTDSLERKIFSAQWDDIYFEGFDTWDYQWDYCRLFSHGIGIVPGQNLITNLGWGADATHTRDENSSLAKLPISNLEFPLKHPPNIELYKRYDEVYFKKLLYRPSWRIPLGQLKKKVKRMYRRILNNYLQPNSSL